MFYEILRIVCNFRVFKLILYGEMEILGKILYHLLIIVAGVYGLLTGFRKGFLRQIDSVVAITFAIVAAYIFGPDIRDWVNGYLQGFTSFNVPFIVATMSAILVFTAVYFILRLAMIPVAAMMRAIPGGVVNSIAGAAYRLFKYMVFLSLAYNLIVDVSPKSSLAKSSRSHDGNVVEGVVKLAPALMGFPSGEEVGHYQQLEDAKKIS